MLLRAFMLLTSEFPAIYSTFLFPAVFAYRQAQYGAGTGRIWMNNAGCSGQEDGLLDCPYDRSTAGCTHSNDAAVKCIAGSKLIHVPHGSIPS